jgi:hypothetical protein
MNNLVVNPKEFGIEEKQAGELLSNLPQIKQERTVLELQYDEVVKMDIENPETAKKARALRLLIRDNRTKGIIQWHKVTKDYFLKGGQFVDAIKRKEVEVNERMEANLEQIEKHFEIKEAARKEELKNLRLSELHLFLDFVPFGIELGSISDDEYSKVFHGAKLQYEAKQEADRIAEEKRQAEIKAEQERIEAQRLENERLKKEAELREAELKSAREKAEAERLKKEAELKEIEEKNKAIIEAERLAREKAEAELKAKQEAELKSAREKAEAEEKLRKEAEKLAKAPIKKQLQNWVDSFEIKEPTISHDKVDEIKAKFQLFKTWCLSEIDKI